MLKDEIELVKKVQTGDEQAFTDLYHAYYTRAIALAYRFTNDYADAQDVVQDTFLQIHKSIRTLHHPEYFYSWMNQIIHSKCVNLFYRNRNVKAVDPAKIESVNVYEEKRRYMLPEDASAYTEEQAVLNKIIAQMDVKYREMIELVYFRQMKLEEIAQCLNIPLGTVKTRCRRAKAELKQRITQFEKAEGRRIRFQANMLLPGISMVSLAYTMRIWKQKLMAFFTGNAVNVLCAVSTVILMVSGSVMVIQDQNNQQDRLSVNETTTTQTYDKQNHPDTTSEKIAAKRKPFGTFVYDNKTITSTREAYFVCINFASTSEEMQTKKQADIDAITPIYEALRDVDDQYYQMLRERGWEDHFIAFTEYL